MRQSEISAADPAGIVYRPGFFRRDVEIFGIKIVACTQGNQFRFG
jgi:hypothetical protein